MACLIISVLKKTTAVACLIILVLKKPQRRNIRKNRPKYNSHVAQPS